MDWFMRQTGVVQALLGTLFTYGVTAAGAALVFFFREVRRKPLDIMMGFGDGSDHSLCARRKHDLCSVCGG